MTDIETLLPFYVNGSLDEVETRRVEDAIKENPTLKDEVAFLQKLREGMKAEAETLSPGAFGLRRLQDSLRAEDPLVRARSKISAEQNFRLWRAAAIAACLALVLQAAIMRTGPAPTYTAAGGHSAKGALSVTFVGTAAEADIRALLTAQGLRIVDGPSALGVYRVTGDDLGKAVQDLSARRDIVETVQEE